MTNSTVRSLLTQAIDQAETVIDTLDMALEMALDIGLVAFRAASIHAALTVTHHAIDQMRQTAHALQILNPHPHP